MTIKNLFVYVDAVKPNVFSDKTKTIWLNEIEGKIQTDVMLTASALVKTYTYDIDMYNALLVKPPHDKLYKSYLCAMVDFANGEYDRYKNSMQMFNKQYAEFTEWYIRIYRPADKGGTV